MAPFQRRVVCHAPQCQQRNAYGIFQLAVSCGSRSWECQHGTLLAVVTFPYYEFDFFSPKVRTYGAPALDVTLTFPIGFLACFTLTSSSLVLGQGSKVKR